MMRIPVHKSIGDHPAPAGIVMNQPARGIEPSDPVADNSPTIDWARRIRRGPL